MPYLFDFDCIERKKNMKICMFQGIAGVVEDQLSTSTTGFLVRWCVCYMNTLAHRKLNYTLFSDENVFSRFSITTSAVVASVKTGQFGAM